MLKFKRALTLTASALAAAGFFAVPAYAQGPISFVCPSNTLCLYRHPGFVPPAREIPVRPGCLVTFPTFLNESETNNSDAIAVLYRDHECRVPLHIVPPHTRIPFVRDVVGSVRFESPGF